MKEIYNVTIKREAIRCLENGELSESEFPKIFGEEFIKIENSEDRKVIINTPKCENIFEAYIKLEELTDILLLELHNRKELLWNSSNPCKKSKYSAKISIDIEFTKEQYDEIKNKINIANRENSEELPQNIEEACSKAKERISKKKSKLQEIYGNIEIENNDNVLTIKNITVNPLDRCGISLNDLMYLISETIASLLNINDLQKVNDIFMLKCRKGIENEFQERTIEKINSLSEQDILQIAKEDLEVGYNERYRLKHYPKLLAEAAILVKDALSQGIDYKILNETTSFVEVNKNGHKEFVIEGNRTDRDSYIFPIVTDDKLISKNIMKEHGLNVPEAILLNNEMEQEEKDMNLEPFYNSKLVVKPRNTNQGTGITVFDTDTTKEEINRAVEYAFKFDKDVLIEEYISGMEYRFLVVDGKCVSVCHRRPASVVGNGKSTIKELIDKKNKEPWHALTYTPVKLDEPVEAYLKTQGYTYESIPTKGERVFLRTNSNCSTGGESLDMTYKMPKYFKEISENAAKVFNAKVAGVDLIIDDMNSHEYSIIEINDDPGYSINEWPYEGKGEKVGISILKLLGY